MFYILFLILHKIYLIRSSANHYLTKKSSKQYKKSPFKVTLKNFLEFINSQGGLALNKICLDVTRFVVTYL